MRKSLFVLFVIFSTTYAIAQLPPTNMYENLKIYESNSLYVNGEKVAFDGKDYLYLDYESDDLYFLFPTEYGWEKESANYLGIENGYALYTVYNPMEEELVIKISTSNHNILAYKETDFVVGYKIISDNSIGGYNNSYSNGNFGVYNSGGYNSNSSSSSSKRTCISCSGTGKCKTCGGKGWYYHETGYYTGNSHKTRTDCPVCRGTGNCGTCRGVGHIN